MQLIAASPYNEIWTYPLLFVQFKRSCNGSSKELGEREREGDEGRRERQIRGLADGQEAQIGGEVSADDVGVGGGTGRVSDLLDGVVLHLLDDARRRVW